MFCLFLQLEREDQGGPLFKSSLTHNIFNEFVSTNLSVKKSTYIQQPFVFVYNGEYKLIADVLDGDYFSDENCFAVSMAGDGWIELLNLFE